MSALPTLHPQPAQLPAEADWVHDYLKPVTLPFQLPTPMYGAMLVIWHMSPGLQRRFPLHKGRKRDYVRYLAWCACDGRRQYAILRAIPDWDAALNRPFPLPALAQDRWAGGFSVAMLLYGLSRHRYTFSAMLDSAIARSKVAREFWRGARWKRHLPAPADWQYGWLAREFGGIEALIAAVRLKERRREVPASELLSEFGLEDVAGHLEARVISALDQPQPDCGADLVLAGCRRSPLRVPIRLIRWADNAKRHVARKLSVFEAATITNAVQIAERPPINSPFPFGVNLFGYARGEIGIGEDVRLVAHALHAQGVPFCIVNMQPGDKISQADESVDHWLVDAPRYAINIVCTTGIELARHVCEQGLEHFRGRYTIGLWPWELPDWPASCGYAYGVVDEIWGISEYTARAYRNAPRPVKVMTLPVTVDVIEPLERADFGLPERDYLFVFSFDTNSTLARKNPLAVVHAFQRAFPKADDAAVGLVLKVSHAETASGPTWRALQAAARKDGRIRILAKTLRKPEVLALFRCCDCYISLHRAEGFGRGLAEALLLDLQVIATGYSGNLDFCSEQRVGLVRHKRRSLNARDYFHGQGQFWAEPDVDHAALLMRDIVEHPRDVAQHQVDFSPESVGQRYLARLVELQRSICVSSGGESLPERQRRAI